ncbi:hypothetical protein HK096_003491 [Nowakowskiella sp. JEL0078]|nr:hypothetical protein HK096_003491 [Nowakowskiella sp. JEL0078]
MSEKLAEAQMEEKQVIKAHEAELRKRIREQKELAQKKITQIREKLTVDTNNALMYLEEQAEKMASKIEIRVVPKVISTKQSLKVKKSPRS